MIGPAITPPPRKRMQGAEGTRKPVIEPVIIRAHALPQLAGGRLNNVAARPEQTPEQAELTALLAGIAGGDQRAFAALYERCSPHLFALLLRMLRRRDWAEEALQDCFLKVWQKSETYAPDKGAPMTWLMTIARYRALDLIRMKRPEFSDSDLESEDGQSVEQAADPSEDPARRAAEQEGLGMLERCMKGLEPEQRDSVLLAFYEGYTHSELAKRLKAPLGTVKSWVRRGLQKLQDCLGTEVA